MPWRDVAAQAFKIDPWQRFFGAVQISQGAFEHRASPEIVLARGMVKGDRHLNQTLKMTPGGVSARDGVPDVLQHLVGVKKMPAVEKADAPD